MNNYAPLRSPLSRSKSSSSSHPLSPFLRSKLLLTTFVSLLLTFLLISYLFDLSPSSDSSSSARPSRLSFPEKGLRRTLWKELDEIQYRGLVFEPVEVGWKGEVNQKTEVPWSVDDFFPKSGTVGSAGLQGSIAEGRGSKDTLGGMNLLKGSKIKAKLGLVDSSTTTSSDDLPLSFSHRTAHLPRHRLEVFPRVPVLPKSASGADKLMFGTVTTVARAKMLAELWSRWLTPKAFDGSRLVVAGEEVKRPSCLIVVSRADEDEEEIKELRLLMDSKGLRCKVKTSALVRYEERVLSMVKELKDYAAELGREYDWYIFNDDDTFWLDIHTVQRMLSKYDPKLDWFVGATTEAQNQLESFGAMAFGGAGMLVSSSVIHKMYGVWDTCYEKYHHVFGGDEMITRCAARATGVTKETVTSQEKGLHQFDIPGDATGVMQSGIPFLNLHHYIGGSWVHLFGYGTYISDRAQILLLKDCLDFLGGDNMFKRYVFGDGKWLVTQGYSITIFEEPLTEKDLTKMEHTWYEEYRLSFEDRAAIPERHDSTGVKVKQTFYIDSIKILSPTTAIFTYVMADKWDEHLPSEERERFEILWDGCWNGAGGVCEKTKELL